MKKHKVKDVPHNCPVVFRKKNHCDERQKPKNCSRLMETKEKKIQLKAICDPRLDPGKEWGKTEEHNWENLPVDSHTVLPFLQYII